MFCLQCVTPASRIVVGGLQFAWLLNSAIRNLALKMTPCSSASLVGFGRWVFCGHYMLGVPVPRALFSVAYSCSDTNKGSTMPALLWVFTGFMQCLTRFATLDLLKTFHKRVDLAAIQKRGRWGSHKSVVRYEKGAKLLR